MLKKLATALAVGLLATTGVAVAGPAQAVNIRKKGCTPGYWKNHTNNWEEYAPTDTVGSAFTFPATPDAVTQYADVTLEEALSLRGGTGLAGAT
jgi:hypothetical protein